MQESSSMMEEKKKFILHILTNPTKERLETEDKGTFRFRTGWWKKHNKAKRAGRKSFRYKDVLYQVMTDKTEE